MDSATRRVKIREILEQTGAPVSASSLAKELKVSRQIIVGDVALLRAGGTAIEATPRGYILGGTGNPGGAHRRQIVSVHSDAQTEEELNLIVDNGCKVVDVIVEHPVYGQLTGLLDISNRFEVQAFLQKIEKTDAHSLCELTDGLHIHTIEYRDEACFLRMLDALTKAGFIYKEE